MWRNEGTDETFIPPKQGMKVLARKKEGMVTKNNRSTYWRRCCHR
jgi:hypothetical protein